MRVRYTKRAFADREAIFEYLNQRDPRAAQKVKAFIKHKIADLSHSPRRARMIKDLAATPCGSADIRTSSTTA
jgi:plasmid stabilization system protein ParE